jgi:hypothetical protein
MLAMTQVTQGVHNSPAFRLSVQLAEAATGHAYTAIKNMLAMTQVTQGVHNSPAFRLSVQLAEAATGHAYTIT